MIHGSSKFFGTGFLNQVPAATGHHLGFNDLKVIEVAGLLLGHCGGEPCFPDFAEAAAVQASNRFDNRTLARRVHAGAAEV